MHSLVKDLMTTPVVTVGPATPFKEIVARLAEHRVSAVPVVDDHGRVLGMALLHLAQRCRSG
jgi:CBS-domain-containing membrane protein